MDLTEKERKYRVGVIKRGLESEFWKILKEEIEREQKSVGKFLDGFKVTCVTEKSATVYNYNCGQLRALEIVLAAPQELVKRHESFLAKAKSYTASATKVFKSYLEDLNEKTEEGSAGAS